MQETEDIVTRLREAADVWGEDDGSGLYSEAATTIATLRAELETERMRLAACGVVAMANTQESAARAREMHPDYWCASVQDVARAVDREMALRAEAEEMRRDAERWRAIRQCRKTVKLYVYEDETDPCSGDWSYKNEPEDFDRFADAAIDSAMQAEKY